MSTPIEINGIFLSVSTQDVLKRWQESGSYMGKTAPERYVEYLNDVQDYLTRIMSQENNIGDITDILTKLIYIKDDLKLFIHRKQQNHEQS